jgi:hypothetical protein
MSYWRVAAWVALCLSGLAVVPPSSSRAPPRGRSAAAADPGEPDAADASLRPACGRDGRGTRGVEREGAIPALPDRRPGNGLQARDGAVPVHAAVPRACLHGSTWSGTGAGLPPARIGLPNGMRFEGYWPPLRVASRLGPNDLDTPTPRGGLSVPDRRGPDGALGLGLLAGAGAALLAGGLLGVLWLTPRRVSFREPERRVNGALSELQYALVVTGLAAGGGPDERRAALESLAVALDQGGHRELASEARSLAWSPRAPRSEAVRKIAASARRSRGTTRDRAPRATGRRRAASGARGATQPARAGAARLRRRRAGGTTVALATRNTTPAPAAAAPRGTVTEIVLDVSGSVGTFGFTAHALGRLSRGGPIGLVVFSDTAEDVLPPAAQLEPLRRLFRPLKDPPLVPAAAAVEVSDEPVVRKLQRRNPDLSRARRRPEGVDPRPRPCAHRPDQRSRRRER